jgi:hypothetical protein
MVWAAAFLATPLSLRAQFFSGSALTADPVSAHGYHTFSGLNPAYAAVFGDGAVFASGQSLAAVLDTLVSSSFSLGLRHPVGYFDGAISANLSYVFVPFSARYVSADVGFAYPVVDQAGHRLLVGGSVGLGSREIIGFRQVGAPTALDRRNRFYPDFDAGLWYTYMNLSLGAGATHLGRPSVEYTSAVTAVIDDLYYLNASYTIDLDGLVITPSFLGRYANSGNFLSDFLADARFDDQFGVGVGYRIDLRQQVAPNPSFPVVQERFQQVLLSAEVGFQDRFSLRGTYTYVLNQFAADRSNFELTLLYRYQKSNETPAARRQKSPSAPLHRQP